MDLWKHWSSSSQLTRYNSICRFDWRWERIVFPALHHLQISFQLIAPSSLLDMNWSIKVHFLFPWKGGHVLAWWRVCCHSAAELCCVRRGCFSDWLVVKCPTLLLIAFIINCKYSFFCNHVNCKWIGTIDFQIVSSKFEWARDSNTQCILNLNTCENTDQIEVSGSQKKVYD